MLQREISIILPIMLLNDMEKAFLFDFVGNKANIVGKLVFFGAQIVDDKEAGSILLFYFDFGKM